MTPNLTAARYLPRNQFHIVKSPFPFFVGSLVGDFQFIPEGVNFVTVLIDADKIIPPLNGNGFDTADLPDNLKGSLLARISAEYRIFTSVNDELSRNMDAIHCCDGMHSRELKKKVRYAICIFLPQYYFLTKENDVIIESHLCVLLILGIC